MKRARDQEMPRRGYGYDRVSGGRQDQPLIRAGVEIGRGMERQSDYAAERCKREGWFLDNELDLSDRGKSGFHKENLSPTAALGRFLQQIKDGRVLPGEVLIVEHLDRLSRADVWFAFRMFCDIIDAGVWIATATPERLYKKDSLGLGDLLEVIISMAANNEFSVKLSERLTKHWQQVHAAAEQGRPHGRCAPSWLIAHADGYSLDPKKAVIVRRIVDLALSGMGAIRIQDYILARPDEFPTLGKRSRWTHSAISHLLANPALAGYYRRETRRPRRPAGDPIAGYYPAIVTEDEWARLRASISHRSFRHGRVSASVSNLFTGLCFFGEHAAPIGNAGRNKAGAYKSFLKGRTPSGKKLYLRYPPLERAILTAISQLRPADVLPASEASSAQSDRIAELNGLLIATDQRITENKRKLASPTSTISVDDLEEAIADLRQQRAQIQAELEPLRWEQQSNAAGNLGTVQTLIEMLDKAAEEGNLSEVRSKLRGALPAVLRRVQLAVQPFPNRRTFAHAMLHFRTGEPRYLWIEPDTGVPKGAIVADLSDPTHPAWAEGYVAADTATA